MYIMHWTSDMRVVSKKGAKCKQSKMGGMTSEELPKLLANEANPVNTKPTPGMHS
jgi:hypothetical protein